RHTRLQGDWSSDVCSSDLARGSTTMSRCRSPRVVTSHRGKEEASMSSDERLGGGNFRWASLLIGLIAMAVIVLSGLQSGPFGRKIGRASCRETGTISVGRG